MTSVRTPILPTNHIFAKKPSTARAINYEAICIFMATGFFMGEDCYWSDEICLAPAYDHEIDQDGFLVRSTPYFKWFHEPQSLSFNQILEEYITLLTDITKNQISDSDVILPLSGGLDSRSQAMIFKNLGNHVRTYSYYFQNGYREDKIAEEIAENCGFRFKRFIIKKGYLWDVIEDLAAINGCYSEFTHPRQMAILPELKKMEGVFSLGHWGDVFFDKGLPDGIEEDELVSYLMKKMVKPKGLLLANKLWEHWGLDGQFEDYLITRIEDGLNKIDVNNLSAKVRAFKTTHWAHRWTTTNLSIFKVAKPITLPYYDDRMCQFICTVPEAYLADRKLQLAHIQKDKELSNITWQSQRPYTINNFHKNKMPGNLPYRIWNKTQRILQGALGKNYVQRNWELQFLGTENAQNLEFKLYNQSFNQWIPKSLIDEMYEDFKNRDPIGASHAVSMLLVLSVWHQKHLAC